jgi:hypothetical protein
MAYYTFARRWCCRHSFQLGVFAAWTSVETNKHEPWDRASGQIVTSWDKIMAATWEDMGARDSAPMHATAFCSSPKPGCVTSASNQCSSSNCLLRLRTRCDMYVEMPLPLQRAYKRFSCDKSCLSGLSFHCLSAVPSHIA